MACPSCGEWDLEVRAVCANAWHDRAVNYKALLVQAIMRLAAKGQRFEDIRRAAGL